MCDQEKLARWAGEAMSRRRFGAVGGAGFAAACAPIGVGTADPAGRALTESTVSFATADGTMDGFFVRPSDKPAPAVLFWPDIAGIREAKRAMARRLAGQGYAVLVANPYYRDVKGEQFADFAAFMQRDGFQAVRPWRAKLDGAAIMRDARSAIGWLDRQDEVDDRRKAGSQGYCMGGPFAIWTAAAAPERFGAAASFHGGGLVRSDIPYSPHTLLRRDTDYLIAIARDDDAKSPGDKTTLRQAADSAGADAVIEVFDGDHGWTVPDSPAYAMPAAEAAWAQLLQLYAGALK